MSPDVDRVQEARRFLAPMDADTVKLLCNALVVELGDAGDDLEHEALQALQSGDYDRAKKLCLMNPCSSYLAAISCMSSAYRSPTVADSVLRDAARHTADVAKKKCEQRIALAFSKHLSH